MSWKQKGLGLIGLGVCLIGVFVAGLFVYVGATATPLHPNPQNVPSVMHVAPSQAWTGAVEQARRIVRENVAGQNLPGVSVAVGAGGEIVWTEGFGWAHLENHAPVTPATQFRIGTTSQTLTAAAVGLLLEKGRLNLDDEIQSYVPAFPRKQWPVTLRHLMAQVSGIGNDAGGEEPVSVQEDEKSARCAGPSDGLQRFAERKLRFEPGSEYRPSTYGWILASAAVEVAAELPFSTFMQKQIFEPLGMNNTTAESPTQPSPDRATFYFPRFSADPRYGPDEGREVDYSCFAGAAAFVSTPTDLVRFLLAINSGKLLQPATVQLLQAEQRLTSGKETGFGLGWDLGNVELSGKPTQVAGYDGHVMGGMVSSFVTVPDGIVVSVTANTAFADTASIALKVAEAFTRHGNSPRQ